MYTGPIYFPQENRIGQSATGPFSCLPRSRVQGTQQSKKTQKTKRLILDCVDSLGGKVRLIIRVSKKCLGAGICRLLVRTRGVFDEPRVCNVRAAISKSREGLGGAAADGCGARFEAPLTVHLAMQRTLAASDTWSFGGLGSSTREPLGRLLAGASSLRSGLPRGQPGLRSRVSEKSPESNGVRKVAVTGNHNQGKLAVLTRPGQFIFLKKIKLASQRLDLF